MIIGVPKEIKDHETRVGLTPGAARELCEQNHKVYVEAKAGEKGGYSDEAYLQAGAEILYSKKELYEKSDFITKVKELLPEEFEYLREGLIIGAGLHSNAHPDEVDALLKNKVTAIAYEDVTDDTGGAPAVKPQSPIAGKGAILMAAHYMCSACGGPGIMLAKVPGCEAAHVTVIGAGHVGLGAAEAAAGLGNNVTVLDLSFDVLNRAKDSLPSNVEFLFSTKENLIRCLQKTDLLVNCVLWPKNRKGHLIDREMLKKYAKKSLFVADVSCDINGAIETCVKASSHSDPLYVEEGFVHYAVDNIPAAFGRTSAQTFCQPMIPYIKAIANEGVEKALKKNPHLRKGLTTYEGMLTLAETGMKQNRPYKSPEEVLGI